MRKKRRLLICGAGALVVLLLVIFSLVAYEPGPAQPAYAGRRLSYWVEVLGNWESTELQKVMATEAIDHIGPAAGPFLVKWIQEKPTKRTERRTNLYELARGAVNAFHILGRRAASARDDLRRVANDSNLTASSHQMAVECFDCLQKDPQPSRGGLFRSVAILPIGNFSDQAASASPALTNEAPAAYSNMRPPPPGQK
jgi:hypothetical protein